MTMEMKLRPPVRQGLLIQLSKDYLQSRKHEDWRFSLVGKFNDDWVPMPQFTQQHLNQLWQLSGKMQIIPFPNSTFVFKLDSEADVQSILKEGPYTVQGSLLMLQPLPLNCRIDEVRFNKVPVWVTLTGLPIDLHDQEVVVSVGQYCGKVIDVEVVIGDFMLGKSSARLRVEIEAEEPLLPGSYVDSGNGSPVWIGFLYEGIPRICGNCRRIGHLDTDCKKPSVQAKHELSKRLEAISKKMNVPMINDPAAESVLSSSQVRPVQSRAISCPGSLLNGGTSAAQSWKRCSAARGVPDPQEMALAVGPLMSPDLGIVSSPTSILFGDYGPNTFTASMDVEILDSEKASPKVTKRKLKK